MPDPPAHTRLGMPFIELQSVDSTNNYALGQIRAGLAHHGTAFFAHEQVAGKGQRGKSWTAERDTSLILSVALDPHPLQIGAQFQLSVCAAVAALEFLKKYAGDAVKIKWPNDLYWHDRKAGGILIENIIGQPSRTGHSSSANLNTSSSAPPSWQWAVIGTGININQPSFPATLANPVSLRQITGKLYDAVDLGKELCLVLDRKFNDLTNNGFASLFAIYLQELYKVNEPVRFKKNNRVFEAVVKTVTINGELIIQHGIEESVAVGEIEWVVKK